MTCKPLARTPVVLRNWKLVCIFLFAELILQCVCHRNTIDEPGPLIKCLKFTDNRKHKHDANSVYIPMHRTSHGIYSPKSDNKFKFTFSPRGEYMCPGNDERSQERTVFWTYNSNNEPASRRNFSTEILAGGIQDPPKVSYFTATAYFYDVVTQNFYKPNGEYCISSIFDDKIILNLCTITPECKKGAINPTLCLPKCCGIDEVLSVPSKMCIPVVQLAGKDSRWNESDTVFSGVSPWIPQIYTGNKSLDILINKGHKIHQNWPSGETQFMTTPITFQMTTFSKNCNAVSAKLGWWVDEKADSIEKLNVSINGKVRLLSFGYPDKDLDGPILPALYNPTLDMWEKQADVAFCVDGYFVEKNLSHDMPLRNNNYNQVVMYCEGSRVRISWESMKLILVAAVFAYGLV